MKLLFNDIEQNKMIAMAMGSQNSLARPISVHSLQMTMCRAFVNNVWYIKILSPEDVHKLGEQAVESFSPQGGQRLNSSNGEAQDLVSGLPSLGMLEY